MQRKLIRYKNREQHLNAYPWDDHNEVNSDQGEIGIFDQIISEYLVEVEDETDDWLDYGQTDCDAVIGEQNVG